MILRIKTLKEFVGEYGSEWRWEDDDRYLSEDEEEQERFLVFPEDMDYLFGRVLSPSESEDTRKYGGITVADSSGEIWEILSWMTTEQEVTICDE